MIDVTVSSIRHWFFHAGWTCLSLIVWLKYKYVTAVLSPASKVRMLSTIAITNSWILFDWLIYWFSMCLVSSCFLSLLLVAAVVWKVKQTCWASRRREVTSAHSTSVLIDVSILLLAIACGFFVLPMISGLKLMCLTSSASFSSCNQWKTLALMCYAFAFTGLC